MASHVVPKKVYFTIFIALLVLTAITVTVSYFNLGPLNTIVALGIASIKGLLVVLYFMHMRYSSRLTWVVTATGLLFLLILMVMTIIEFETRRWI